MHASMHGNNSRKFETFGKLKSINNCIGHAARNGDVKYDFDEKQKFRNLVLFIDGHEEVVYPKLILHATLFRY
jgi:hypothetical protein